MGPISWLLRAYRVNSYIQLKQKQRVQRALIYIEFANKRLDEAEALQKKGKSPAKILPVIEKFLENEQFALSVMTKETARVENTTPVYVGLRALLEKQEKILNRFLETIPAPEFYQILDIKTKSMEALNEYNLR